MGKSTRKTQKRCENHFSIDGLVGVRCSSTDINVLTRLSSAFLFEGMEAQYQARGIGVAGLGLLHTDKIRVQRLFLFWFSPKVMELSKADGLEGR